VADFRSFWPFVLAAFLVEAAALHIAGLEPTSPSFIAAAPEYLEASVLEPAEAHLTAPASSPAPREVTLSRRTAQPSSGAAPPENVAAAAPPPPTSHGPVAIFSETPKLPSYLEDKNINASVVIDFDVAATGESTPHLAGSSGDQELDALALASARRWRFRSAEEHGAPVPARVRLRVQFEVN
jgi:TonB family protein